MRGLLIGARTPAYALSYLRRRALAYLGSCVAATSLISTLIITTISFAELAALLWDPDRPQEQDVVTRVGCIMGKRRPIRTAEYYAWPTISLSSRQGAESFLHRFPGIKDGPSKPPTPFERLQPRCEVPYAPFVVPDLLALSFHGAPKFLLWSVAVLGTAF